MVTQQAVRRWIMTAAVTSITITGALYGAGLKGQQDVKQHRSRVTQSPPEELIAQLEEVRASLVNKKMELQRKVDTFEERRRERLSGKGWNGKQER